MSTREKVIAVLRARGWRVVIIAGIVTLTAPGLS
jgi:hypothetical protein